MESTAAAPTVAGHGRAHTPSQPPKFAQTILGATRPAGFDNLTLGGSTATEQSGPQQPIPYPTETSTSPPAGVPISPYAPGGSGGQYAPPQAAHREAGTDGVPNPYAGPREASQPYSPIPLNRPQPFTPPPRRSRKGLVIGLAIAAAALVAIIVVVVVAGGGSSRSERDALIVRAFAALADEEQMTKLIDVEKSFDKFLDCSPDAKAKDDDSDDDYDPPSKRDDDEPRGKQSRRRHIERTEKEIATAIDMADGAKLEVIEILTKEPALKKASDDDKDEKGDKDAKDADDAKDAKDVEEDEEDGTVMRHEAGKRVMSGCYAKVDHTIQFVRVKLRVTPKDGEPYDDFASIILVHLAGDRWYVIEPPHVYTGDSKIVSKARGFRDRMCECKDLDCLESVETDFDKWRDDASTEDLPEDEDAGYDSVRDDYRACKRKIESANKGVKGERALKQMTALRDEMCRCSDSSCADGVKRNAKLPDSYDLDDTTRKKVNTLRDEYYECSTKAIVGSYRAYDPDLRIEPDIAPACEEYARAMQKLAACSKYPQGAKDDLKESFKTMMGLWKGYSLMKPEVQRATNDTCISGRRSTQESMTKYGCF